MSDSVHVTFIHGVGNKPAPTDLRRIWLEALARPVKTDQGFDLEAVGVSASFVYWASFFYEQPLPASDYENIDSTLASSEGDDPELADDDWTRSMLEKFPEANAPEPLESTAEETQDEFERIPLPWFVKRSLMRRFVKETHDYLFNVDNIRDKIRAMVVEDLDRVPAGTRHVLAGHSQGSIIAYDVLTSVPECKEVDGFLTLGSPLGIDEIQDKLDWTREDGFPGKVRDQWVNVFDPLDAIARLDPRLANDFRKGDRKVVRDIKQDNKGVWRHSATKYFHHQKLRHQLRLLSNREDA